MKYRHRVLALLATLSVLTYLDRVCISVAGPRIQNELNLSPQDWGLVTGAFSIAYALFEIPSGYLGDIFGARAMLTRIVLWWSAFTALTGFASKLWSLLIIRFCFGAGEAGAYPTASTSIYRWFPASEGVSSASCGCRASLAVQSHRCSLFRYKSTTDGGRRSTHLAWLESFGLVAGGGGTAITLPRRRVLANGSWPKSVRQQK